MANIRTGGCLCGAVRYSIEWPPLAIATCHCRNCQKQAGSALSVVAFLKREQLRLQGDLTTFEDRGDSGDTVLRKFCGRCGSPVITETPSATAQGTVFVKAGTLDQPRDLLPTIHYWTCSAQQWFVFPEGSSCLPRQ
jgi:hypothetical protein